jgi:hypothetical protein
MPFRLVAYFSRPFPKAEGFSAYRMPGAAVHLPVALALIDVGFLLCRQSPWFPAALAIYAIAGLYVGRDLAILAHYNGLITLAVWLGGAFLVFESDRVSAWALSLTATFPHVPLVVTAAMLLGFVAHVAYWCRKA